MSSQEENNREVGDKRPDPEALLKAILHEEGHEHKGRLKIFLGMAAGVGKTYAMLEEAQRLHKQGVDVKVGCVYTHKRKETEALLHGLTIIPEKDVYYKNRTFSELNLDEIIACKPALVLVDELAHSNVPGSRHPKRWQDVAEILDKGIDVYTTLNVQHIETLKDIVKGITEVSMQETVPDIVIEAAHSIKIVDITTEELLERLKEGKVYLKDQSQRAIENFFQKDRLTALREIVLRYGAEKVDHDLSKMAPLSAKAIEWKLREKFLVAVSHTLQAQKLIRTTRRLAANMDASWIAVYIDDGKTLNENDREQLIKNLALARDLGGEVVTAHDSSKVDAIERIARQRGITQIILGRPPKRRFLRFFKRISLLDKLISRCQDVDIYVIRQERFLTAYRKDFFSVRFQNHVYQYFIAFISVVLLALINAWTLPTVGYQVVGSIFLLGILGLSLFLRKGPIFFASIFFALVWGIFFIPPQGIIAFEEQENIFLLILYVFTAIITGVLVDRARERKKLLIKSEQATQTLYDIVQKMAGAHSLLDLNVLITEYLSKLFKGDFYLLTQNNKGELFYDVEESPIKGDEKEISTAMWAYQNSKEAGLSTDTLPSSPHLYIPLKGLRETVGLLIYTPKDLSSLAPEEKNLLYAVCQQVANYIERAFIEERAKEKVRLEQKEKVHRDILKRLAQEFEWPLSAFRHAMHELQKKIGSLKQKIDVEEINEMESSYEAFIKIFNNILTMAQISEGLIPLKKKKQDIRPVIDQCVESSKKFLGERKLKLSIIDRLPLIFFDSYLIEMVLYNLILNAIENSSSQSTIEIEVLSLEQQLVVSVSNEGEGIPEGLLDVIFEKFYRLPESTSPGIGLGLAIARTIAEIHHGYIKAENLPRKGAKFSLFLPLGP